MEGNQSRRIDFVDLTKGVCIILVVMAHVGGAFEQLDTNSMLSCFRMPLYFFISGVFFKSYEGLFGFILRKINKLIIPFLFFYLSAFLMKYIVWKIAPGVFQLPVSWNELLVVFHGHDLIKFNPPIWFLLALFNCNILFYLIHFLREKHLPVMFAVTILIGCAGFYLGKLQIELPLYIDVSMTALPFYVAGFWIRRYNFFLYPSHRFDKLIPVFVVLALVVMYFTATTLGMRTNNYAGNIFQVYIAAFAGIFMIMLLCKKVKKIKVVSYLGRYSIITLSIHGPILHFLGPLVSRYIHNSWAQASALLLITLSICLLLTPVFLKVIPQMVAQKDLLKVKKITLKRQYMKINSSYILLKEIRCYAYHGVAPQENLIGNEYLIDLKLKVDISKATRTDEVTDTVNYAEVHQVIKNEMAVPSKLLEHVSGRIIQKLFDQFPCIEEIELRLSKRNPPMGADIESAGIELHCSKK